jgi:hypothetical protein
VLRGALETVNLVVIKTHLSHGFRDTHDNRTPHAGAGLGRGELGDQTQDLREQHSRHGNLGHLEGDVAPVADHFAPVLMSFSLHRRIIPQALGVVDVLLAGEPPEH